MTGQEIVFAAFGLTSQALLVLFFAARRWWPDRAVSLGVAAYSFAPIGLPLGGWLALVGASWRLVAGPLLLAAWAVLGITVDLRRPRPWRGPHVDWNVLVPYVALYLVAQMFLWWPLWDLERIAWVAFLVLFVANTALNIRAHIEAGAG